MSSLYAELPYCGLLSLYVGVLLRVGWMDRSMRALSWDLGGWMDPQMNICAWLERMAS